MRSQSLDTASSAPARREGHFHIGMICVVRKTSEVFNKSQLLHNETNVISDDFRVSFHTTAQFCKLTQHAQLIFQGFEFIIYFDSCI